MSELKNVVIVSGVRLPVGSFGGSLKDISAIDMGAMVVKEAVNRNEDILSSIPKWHRKVVRNDPHQIVL